MDFASNKRKTRTERMRTIEKRKSERQILDNCIFRPPYDVRESVARVALVKFCRSIGLEHSGLPIFRSAIIRAVYAPLSERFGISAIAIYCLQINL